MKDGSAYDPRPQTDSATVTISPASVTITSGTKTDFVYDGKKHAYTNLTVTGFIAGEGLATTTDWASVTTVAEGADNNNTFHYTLKSNTLPGNYLITPQYGTIKVKPAPVDPVEPADPSDNPDDEPDPTDGPTIWARNVVKVYDGVGTNVIAKVYNAVNGNTFTYEYSTNKIDFVADLQFTNVVDGLQVWYRAMTAQGNYLGVTNFAFVTITPAQIQGVETEDEPWATATSVECYVDEIPEGGKTNIIVKTDGFFGSDEPTLTYTTDGGWSAIGVYTNWCTVSCEPNYLPTNLMATVKIKEREGEVEGDKEPENAEDIEETMKDIAKDIAEDIKDETGTDPIYVDVRLVVNSTNNLPQAEQEQAAKDSEKLDGEFGKVYPNYEDVEGYCIDIKLELTTTPDPQDDDWTNIGSNNNTMVDIEITPECALADIVAFFRCHYDGSGQATYEKIDEVNSKPDKTSTKECWWRDTAHSVALLHVNRFSLFKYFTGTKVESPCQGICSWVYLNGATPGVDPATAEAVVSYDFSAAVRTTKGRKGKDSYSAYYPLGRNAAGRMWYNADGTILADLEAAGAIAFEAGKSYPTLLLERDGTIRADKGKAELEDRLVEIAKTYNLKSEGRYCATFRRFIPGVCFRVVGSQRLSGTYTLDTCCTETINGGYFKVIDDSNGYLPPLSTTLIHRFGAQTEAKAQKVEMMGFIEDEKGGQTYLRFAGQGTVSRLRDADGAISEGVSAVRGNIVGYLPVSVCLDCCTELTELPDAVAFDCIGTKPGYVPVAGGEVLKYDPKDSLARTAAFGTFAIKFNPRKSSFRKK